VTPSPNSGPLPVVGQSSVNPVGGGVVYQYNTSGGNSCVSQTLQLNQIPDKLVFFVRKPIGSQSYGDADAFLPIRHISINFNNNSGILASATCENLFAMSKDNGSNQSWEQWIGFGSSLVGPSYNYNTGILNPIGALANLTAAAQANLAFTTVRTCGGVCVLEFGKDIQLIEDFFAPGSLGNFNIQLQVYVENNQALDYSSATGQSCELVMITMNSGKEHACKSKSVMAC
jgi:hypothetical protein